MSFLRCSLHEPNEEMEITVKWFVGRQMLLSSPSCSNCHRFLVDSGFLFTIFFDFPSLNFFSGYFSILQQTHFIFHVVCADHFFVVLSFSFVVLFSSTLELQLNTDNVLWMQERDDVCKSDVGKKYRCFGIQFWTIVLKVIIIFFTVHSFGMFTKCSVFLCNTVINWDIGRHQPTRWCNKINKKNESRKKEIKNN